MRSAPPTKTQVERAKRMISVEGLPSSYILAAASYFAAYYDNVRPQEQKTANYLVNIFLKQRDEWLEKFNEARSPEEGTL